MGVEIAAAYISLLPSFKGGARKIRAEMGAPIAQAAQQEGKRSGGIFSKAFGGAMAGAFSVIKGGALAGAAGLGALGFIGLKTASDLEQARISFETLLGSGKKADRFLGQLKGFAAKTPFELPGLISSARQLLGVGQSAKSVIPSLTAWGDAAGALGINQEGFERTMLAVTQSMAKGKIQAEELMQITEAGVPIWKILSRALKKPIPELQKLSSEGKLLAKDVWPKVEKQLNKDFGGSMAKQSKTLAGLWSTFMDTLKLGLADALTPIIPILKDALPGAMAGLGRALAGASKGLAALVAFGQDVSKFIGNIVEGFRSGGKEGGEFASKVGGIAEFFSAIGAVLADFGKDLLAVLVPGFKSVAGVVSSKLLPALNRFLPVVKPIAVFLLKVLAGTVIAALKAAFQIIRGVFTAISGLLDIFTAIFTGDWKLLWSGVKDLFAGIWEAIIGLVKLAWNVGILKAFRLGFSLLKGIVIAGAKAVVGFFKALPGRILSALGNLGKLLLRKGLELLKGFLNGVKNYYLTLAQWWIGLPARIVKALGNLGTVLFEAGKDLIRGLLNGIKSMAGEVANSARNVVSGAIDAAKHALGLGSPSKVFKQFGVWTLEGFLAGVGKMTKKTRKAVAGVLTFGPTSSPSTPLGTFRPGPGGGAMGGVSYVFNVTMNGVNDPAKFFEELQRYTDRNPGRRLRIRTA